VDPLEAVALQTQLRSLVRLCALPSPPRLVAGVDVAYSSFDADGPLAAAVVVLDLASLTVVDSATATGTSSFPYVPGLLAFRELPFIRTAL
jgi:deoxyribonuclease V